MSAESASMLRLTMPVHEDVIDCLFEYCISQKLYDRERGIWIGMPRPPIEAIGQCIHAACQDDSTVKINSKSLKEVQHGTSGVETVNGTWNMLPTPNKESPSRNSLARDTRPRIDFSMNSKERVKLSNEVDEIMEALREVWDLVIPHYELYLTCSVVH